MATSNITHDFLDSQADQIEWLLASHRVPVRVAGGAVTPRWIRYELAPGATAKIASIRNLSEELSLALGVQASPLFVSSYFLFFTAFVGLNLFQSGFTRFCPLSNILSAFGIKGCC